MRIRITEKREHLLHNFTGLSVTDRRVDGHFYHGCTFHSMDVLASVCVRTAFLSCRFINCDFTNTNFHDCVFCDCKLNHTRFIECSIANNNFCGGTDFPNTTFSDGIFKGNNFLKADLRKASFLNQLSAYCIGDGKYVKNLVINDHPVIYTYNTLTIGSISEPISEWRNDNNNFGQIFLDNVFRIVDLFPAESTEW